MIFLRRWDGLREEGRDHTKKKKKTTIEKSRNLGSKTEVFAREFGIGLKK